MAHKEEFLRARIMVQQERHPIVSLQSCRPHSATLALLEELPHNSWTLEMGSGK